MNNRRHRHWIILVWIVVGFFLFPLTPPISQNISFGEHVVSQMNETPAFMRIKSESSQPSVPAIYPAMPWKDWEDEPDPCFPLLYVLFVVFLYSKLRERLRKYMLAPLKFTSAYVAYSHST
ncbi:hypothetical protein [Paenibacillus rigui]|uniref:Uncharacterized protein n=1 Tax=Paenibacillus rigui TaxID=554312 RepID=A0A229UQI0_9BACL|nr:hypothetical protein [Paenibacillus rigui]OXM85698.1 hypothetical protein CF651_14080 [Paenibacillus rigui]